MKSYKHESIFETSAAQGDLLIIKIGNLPDGVSEKFTKDENIVLAHSESGHHHVIPSCDASLFVAADDDVFKMFIVVKGQTQIKHLKNSPDRHESIDVSPGVYQINRAREYTPDGFRVAQD